MFVFGYDSNILFLPWQVCSLYEGRGEAMPAYSLLRNKIIYSDPVSQTSMHMFKYQELSKILHFHLKKDAHSRDK